MRRYEGEWLFVWRNVCVKTFLNAWCKFRVCAWTTQQDVKNERLIRLWNPLFRCLFELLYLRSGGWRFACSDCIATQENSNTAIVASRCYTQRIFIEICSTQGARSIIIKRLELIITMTIVLYWKWPSSTQLVWKSQLLTSVEMLHLPTSIAYSDIGWGFWNFSRPGVATLKYFTRIPETPLYLLSATCSSGIVPSTTYANDVNVTHSESTFRDR